MRVYRSETGGSEGPIRVGVADYAVTSADTRVTTTGLGSCLGIALTDAEAGVSGLAHVMLPSAPESGGDKAKFADTAIATMLDEMQVAGAAPASVEARIAGGSSMLDLSGVGKDVGERNVATTRDALASRDVPIVGEDTGGSHGRSLELHAATGRLVVKSAHAGVTRI